MGVGKHTRGLIAEPGSVSGSFALDCTGFLGGRGIIKEDSGSTPLILLGLEEQQTTGLPPPHTNQAFCLHPSSAGSASTNGQQLGLGSYLFIKQSEGLKTRAPRSSRGAPHNAEAKPIYWLIGRRCWCGGTEIERAAVLPPHTLGGHPPSPPRRAGSCP